MFSRLLSIWVIAFNPVAQSVECGPGQHWVNPHHRRAYYRGDGTFVKAADVQGHCRTSSPIYATWYQRLSRGKPPSWFFPNEEPANWTAEEVERIIEALEEAPRFLRDQGITGLFRLKKSAVPENPATTKFPNIALYDIAFEGQYNLSLIISHEFSHPLFESLSTADVSSFLKVAGWRVNNKDQVIERRNKSEFIRENAMLSPLEDFADSVAYFIHQPSKLRATSPRIYDWMEKHLKSKLGNRGGE